jgi:hypothetical protein
MRRRRRFQCRERLEWDFYATGWDRPETINNGFSAANGLSGISTRYFLAYAGRKVSGFQCRERLEWDFYLGSGCLGRVDGKAQAFQCRERLEWDFYSIPHRPKGPLPVLNLTHTRFLGLCTPLSTPLGLTPLFIERACQGPNPALAR